MTASAGLNFLLKDGSSGGGTTIAGMRATAFKLNGTTVDVTSKDSAGFKTLLGGGIVSMSITASGVLEGAAEHMTLLNRLIAQTISAYGIVFDAGATLDFNAKITGFDADGPYDKEQTYSLTLESSGTITVAGGA